VTTSPDNPFGAHRVGELYRRGRPYHHPRSLARVRGVVAAAGAEIAVERALDIACGTGMSTIALADFAAAVVGVDISHEMMRVALPADNVSYLLGRAEQLAFADGAFDAVTCSSGVHWFDQQRFYAELHRIVRPGGWVGLYDHYFMGMPDVAAFEPWTHELFARYPLPPRNPQVGDPRSETPAGFELLGAEFFEDPIKMTREEFADYQITISSCVAAAQRGTPLADIHAWLMESTAALFANSTRVVQFLGSITCLRRLP